MVSSFLELYASYAFLTSDDMTYHSSSSGILGFFDKILAFFAMLIWLFLAVMAASFVLPRAIFRPLGFLDASRALVDIRRGGSG
jgi:hypothetical protein